MSNYTYNEVPLTDDEKIIKTLAFPYQKGKLGFPALAYPSNYTFVQIVSLLMTGVGDRVMHPDMGVRIDDFVFENMTSIQRVRLANMVKNSIEKYIPGTIVNRVSSSDPVYQDGVGTMVTFNITYTVGGQTKNEQVPYVPTTQGQ